MYSFPQEQIMEYLQEAAENGEVIPLTYYGGSHPGETRSVVPTTVYKTRFHGICMDSGKEKTYLYEKCYFPQLCGMQKRNSFSEYSCHTGISNFSTKSKFAESSRRFSEISGKASPPKNKGGKKWIAVVIVVILALIVLF